MRSAEFYKYAQEPFFNARDHMLDDCTHAIDTLRYMCGGEVAAIESHCKRIGVPDINWIGAQIQFDNGSTGYVINSWSSGKRIFRVQMHAPGIFVDADLEGQAHLYRHGDLEGKTYDARQEAGGDQYYIYGGFRAKSRRVYRLIEIWQRGHDFPISGLPQDHGGNRKDFSACIAGRRIGPDVCPRISFVEIVHISDIS